MNTNILRIAGIQANLVWENPKTNITYFDKKISEISAKADLIVLPEMFTTGFTMQPKKVSEPMDGYTLLWMKKTALKYNIALTGSLIIKENNNFYNRLVFMHASGEVEIYDKRHSFTLAGEDKVYTSGSKKVIINYKGWKICPLICYDLRFPVWARNAENYDILLYIANWPVARIKAWEILLKARAIENMSYTIGVNRIGKDANDYQYSGNSIIVDYLGEELASLAPFKEGIIYAKLAKSSQNKAREKLGFLKDRDTFKLDF